LIYITLWTDTSDDLRSITHKEINGLCGRSE